MIKLDSFLPDFPPDGVYISILIKKSYKHHLGHIGERRLEDGEVRSKQPRREVDHPIYFEGVFNIVLPIKPMIVETEGKSIEEMLANGFLLLHKGLRIYKGKYFKGHSEYRDRRSIRKEEAYEETE